MKFIILLIVIVLLSGCVGTQKKPEKTPSRPMLKFSKPEKAEKFYQAVKNQGTGRYPTQDEVDKWECIK